ncbi:tetratricopeptide repeat protein [Thermosulfuriphilus sp.]
MARLFILGIFVFTLLGPSLAWGDYVSEIGLQAEDQGQVALIIRGKIGSIGSELKKAPARIEVRLRGLAAEAQGLPPLLSGDSSLISKVLITPRGKDLLIRLYLLEDQQIAYKVVKDPGEVRVVVWKEGVLASPTDSPSPSRKISTYSGQKITVDFYKADIHNVFRLLGDISGRNFIVDEGVEGTITLSLRDVPWDLALELILDLKNLEKEERLNTILIRPHSGKKEAETQQGEAIGELKTKIVSPEVIQMARLIRTEKKAQHEARELVERAWQLEKKGQRLQAIVLYERAYELNSESLDVAKKLAYLHYQAGNYFKAAFYSQAVLKKTPLDAEAALYGALAEASLGNQDKAEVLFKKALTGRPHIPEAYYNYAAFLERQGRLPEALRFYERYEELAGPSLQVAVAKARVLEKLDPDRACQNYEQLIRGGFNLPEVVRKILKERRDKVCQGGGQDAP